MRSQNGRPKANPLNMRAKLLQRAFEKWQSATCEYAANVGFARSSAPVHNSPAAASAALGRFGPETEEKPCLPP
jgi:hypothetical protein